MQAFFENIYDFFASIGDFFPQEGHRTAQKAADQAERPANRLPDPVENQGDRMDHRARKSHDQPPQCEIVGGESGRQPHEQIKTKLSAGQRQVEQERGRRRRGKKEYILKKHGHRTAGNHQPDDPKHIIIHADEKAEPAA